MPSLLGKALALQNAAPVPMGDSGGFYKLPGLSQGANQQETFMRAFGTVGTVWQIVHLLASNVAKPEWRLYRSQHRDGRVRYTTSDQGSDQRTEVVKHAALSLINKPNPFYSRFGLFETSQQYQELTGEWFWVVERDGRSSIPLGLWPVRPDRMDAVPDREKYLLGWVYTAPDGQEKIPLPASDVIQCKLPNPLDPYRGLGPVQAVLLDIDNAKYSAEWNRNFWLNSAEPGGVIQIDHKVEEEEWNDLVNRWRESHRGVARAHRVAVLEGGQTWVPNAHTLRDMEFVNGRNLSRDVIREAWGIHKIMLGNSDDVNRANAQTGEEVFANWSVAPRLDRWRDALNYQLLPLFGSAGQGVEFDYVYPLPQNREQDNAELLAKAQGALWLTQAGYDGHAVLQVVGLPDMSFTAPTAIPPAAPGEAESTDVGDDGPASQSTDISSEAPAFLAKKDAAAKVFEQVSQDYPPAAMAWIHHATWMGPARVQLSHIKPDIKQMNGADPAHVQEFVDLLQKGKKLKPVILVKTPAGVKLKLIDGHHRYLAYAEMDMPVRGFIGTVTEEHGPWEDMHDYQLNAPSTGTSNMAPFEWLAPAGDQFTKVNGHSLVEAR